MKKEVTDVGDDLDECLPFILSEPAGQPPRGPGGAGCFWGPL